MPPATVRAPDGAQTGIVRCHAGKVPGDSQLYFKNRAPTRVAAMVTNFIEYYYYISIVLHISCNAWVIFVNKYFKCCYGVCYCTFNSPCCNRGSNASHRNERSGPCRFRQEDFFENCILKTLFYPITYLCNQLERFEQLWVGDHPGIIPVKFGQN